MKNETQTYRAAFGGGIEIQLADGRKVLVKALPVRAFPALSESVGDECALVELFTGLAPEAVDALAIEDFEAILEKGKEINFPPFFRWGKRQRRTAEMFAEICGESPIQDATSGAIGANASD